VLQQVDVSAVIEAKLIAEERWCGDKQGGCREDKVDSCRGDQIRGEVFVDDCRMIELLMRRSFMCR
jgi:hypothetical protein